MIFELDLFDLKMGSKQELPLRQSGSGSKAKDGFIYSKQISKTEHSPFGAIYYYNQNILF